MLWLLHCIVTAERAWRNNERHGECYADCLDGHVKAADEYLVKIGDMEERS